MYLPPESYRSRFESYVLTTLTSAPPTAAHALDPRIGCFVPVICHGAHQNLDPNLINASRDLGANRWDTFRRVIFPLSMNGVRSGVQSVFIPSLSLFMLTRLIGGNRVITLGTAIEQHFLTTQNWGMGSTIGVVLIIAMLLIMWATKERRDR